MGIGERAGAREGGRDTYCALRREGRSLPWPRGPEGSHVHLGGRVRFRSLVQRRGERLKKKKFFFNKVSLLWLMKGDKGERAGPRPPRSPAVPGPTYVLGAHKPQEGFQLARGGETWFRKIALDVGAEETGEAGGGLTSRSTLQKSSEAGPHSGRERQPNTVPVKGAARETPGAQRLRA